MLCIRRSQSMGGGTKQKNLIDTAPESIDSLRRTALCRNDMLSGACFCPRWDDIPVEACTALRRNDMLSAACFCPRRNDIPVEARFY